jgi:hypothetical protein
LVYHSVYSCCGSSRPGRCSNECWRQGPDQRRGGGHYKSSYMEALGVPAGDIDGCDRQCRCRSGGVYGARNQATSTTGHHHRRTIIIVITTIIVRHCDDCRICPGDVASILRETLYTRRFWRFLVVCIITLNVRMIFRHMDATLPKYMVREFGPNVAKGTIYSINPAIIVLLVPVMTAATSNRSPLLMIHHGSYVSALSVFVLVLSTSIWSSVAFVTLLSIGEAIWSPRLYDYTMKVCTEGREGTYMALSSAPLFLATLPVGFMSGYLLDRYCPETGPRNSKMMWFIIGVTTISSPVFMTVFWKYISYDDDLDNAIELANVEYSEIPTRLPADKQNPYGSFEEETPPDE